MMLGKQEPNWLALDRRSFCLGAAKGLVFTALAARLYHLQLTKGFNYRLLSDKRRISIRFIGAPRGILKDRQGTILALQKNAFHAFLSLPKGVRYDRKMFYPLMSALSLSPLDVLSIEEEYKVDKHPLIKAKLSWEEVSWLEARRDAFPYISIEVNPIRHYCFPEAFSHVLGYVGFPKEKQKASLPPYIGKCGLEKMLEERIQGRNGYYAVVVNACNQSIRKLESLPSVSGETITLSLHQPLQTFIAERVVEHQSASAVVMKVDTGEVLSLVSHPGFQSNLFSGRIPKAYWEEMISSPHTPLLNKALSGLYPPGSLVKMAIALAGLQSNVIDAFSTVHCSGVFWVKNHPFHCHVKRGHGNMTVVEALMCSCDTFFYWLASKVPPDTVTHYLTLLGFGTRLVPELVEEKAGLIPTPEWKQRTQHAAWSLGDSVLRSIGQGAFLATPLQLATMMARIATGQLVTPTFLYQEQKAPFPSLPINPEHLALVHEGLYGVVNNSRGTAFPYRWEDGALQMAGKTATSQVRRITQQQRLAGLTTSFHLPWNQREHTLFSAYAPKHNPLYSMSVIIEHGIRGAAAIARDIFSFMKTQQFFSNV